MPTAVTTRSYDNARTGANTAETVLTPDAVRAHGIRRLFSLQLDGDKRGIEAQPLVVPGVTVGDGSTHDVIYLADMANQVWAFDFANGHLLWKTRLGAPVKGSGAIDSHLVNDHWGVMGTPVIDRTTRTMYAVAWSSPDGSVARAQHFLHAVSIRDGHEVHAPLNLEGVTYAPGHGLPTQQFRSAARKQRPGLLLTSTGGVTTIFVGFGSVQETSDSSRGWVVACGTSPFQITAAWAATCRGHGAGIWQAGAGLAADRDGAIYAITGNGDFDGVTDFGESFVKLRYKPPAGGRSGALAIVDWWTPWTDAQRVAGRTAATTPRVAPTNFRPLVASHGMDGWDDQDLGSGGPVLIPSSGSVAGAGKDGILYMVDQARMGTTKPADLANPAANYAKLKSPPVFFTYYPPDLSPAPADIRTLNVLFANATHHLHGTPLSWDSPDHGPMLFCWGENGNLRAWSVDAVGAVKFLAYGAEQASAQVPAQPLGPHGGMPGGMMTLSANGRQAHSGIVWATIPYFDANLAVGPGRLLAYDATAFGAFPNGDRRLQVLWDSERWALTFSFNKFNPPVVANGRVIVPTYDDRVDVYGP
jgi:hypothetical protein